MTPTFRQFKKGDWTILSKLIQLLYQEDPEGESITKEKIQKTFHSLSAHPDKGAIMVIEVEDSTIGYAILINFWSNELGGNILNIDELYILQEFRSQGLGSGLIKYLISSGFANSVAIRLEVTPENSRARELYKSLGFLYQANQVYQLLLNERTP